MIKIKIIKIVELEELFLIKLKAELITVILFY